MAERFNHCSTSMGASQAIIWRGMHSDLGASIQTSEVFMLACVHSGGLETESDCKTRECRQTSEVFAPRIEHTLWRVVLRKGEMHRFSGPFSPRNVRVSSFLAPAVVSASTCPPFTAGDQPARPWCGSCHHPGGHPVIVDHHGVEGASADGE